MTNTLLKHFKKSPDIGYHTKKTFPLLEQLGSLALKDGHPNFDVLRQHYGNAIYINPNTPGLQWREECLSVEDLEGSLQRPGADSRLVLNCFGTDSFTIQAQRKGAREDHQYIETCIYGFTKGKTTNGTEILFGERGGSEGGIGKLLPIPGGSVELHHTIEGAVEVEGLEEAGIKAYELSKLDLIGVFRQEADSSQISNFFVYVSNLNHHAPPEVIPRRHQRFMELYKKEKANAIGTKDEIELQARASLRGAARVSDDIAVDCWENRRAVLIESNPDVLIDRMKREVETHGKLYHSVAGAAALYFLHEFGEEVYRELMDLSFFRKGDTRVIENFL
ncbi:MAG: hypothetical protein KJ597_00560 [Nanoarchaeota archaeon]|nr:hypothetical protein [Nanoarchaeota archaeon]MBU1622044.1 hypothetical protein [Nanoarchaeota archaeon]